MTRFVPLKGNPRPAGLERIAARLERTSGGALCSMIPIGVCLTPDGGDREAILRVTMREGGKRDSTTYYLCHACAVEGGDLREGGPEEEPATGLRIAPGSVRPSSAPGTWDAEVERDAG